VFALNNDKSVVSVNEQLAGYFPMLSAYLDQKYL
jgi:hypothetical protein